ncbi:hypothetical protein [Rhizobium sp.]
MNKPSTSIAIWLRIFCAALLLSLGLGHKPVFAGSSAGPASSYYLLPDGTFSDICIDNADRGKPQKSWFGSGCELCRLSGAVLLPAPPVDLDRASGDFHAIAFRLRLALADARIPRPGSPVRGPPSFFA